VEAIDQAPFNFSPTVGLAVGVMVGFLVFAVALDLTWAQFHRVLRRPKAPLIGLVAQYLVLPSVAFGVGLVMVDTPSIALGLLLVTCCPAGALSN
jgi:BASS family bile acid:Na+ symporter